MFPFVSVLAVILLFCCSSCLRKTGVEQSQKAPVYHPVAIVGASSGFVAGTEGYSFHGSYLSHPWETELRYSHQYRNHIAEWSFVSKKGAFEKQADTYDIFFGPRLHGSLWHVALLVGPEYFDGTYYGNLDSVRSNYSFGGLFGSADTNYYHLERLKRFAPAWQLKFGVHDDENHFVLDLSYSKAYFGNFAPDAFLLNVGMIF